MAQGEPSESQQSAYAYRSALHVALGYVLISALWIVLSDQLLRIPPPGSAWIVRLSVAKGWAFVFVTGTFLYVLLRHRADRILQAERAYHAAVERAEQQKRLFFQNTIAAVTEGKMLVRNPGALDALPTPSVTAAEVTSAEQASYVREQVRQAIATVGFPKDRIADLVVAAGEAITNAIKHAEGGQVSVHVGRGCVWIRVADHGPGIADLMLPRVVLERGYSTKPSLGMGYTLMLALADRLYLTTGVSGTTVVLEMCQNEATGVSSIAALGTAALAL